MDLGLSGKRAIVTGGSRGIGKAIVHGLATEGATCVAVSRNEEAGRATAEAISEATGSEVIFAQGDVSDPDSVGRVVDLAMEEMGGIDILVNSAARAGSGAPDDLDNVDDATILTDFEEKYLGYLRMAREVIPHMKSAGSGRIVNISGMASRRAGPISAGARNIAVVHLSAVLARQLGQHGISVNVVHPGITVTEQLLANLEEKAREGGPSVEDALARMGSANSLGRLLTAEEVAAVVVFLSSNRAIGVNAEAIAVAGGVGDAVRY